MRAPMLLAGIASLWLLPLLFRPHIGRNASIAFAGLLAISPVHVFYSRFARSYSIALLLSVLALIAWDRWRATRSRRWAVLQVACAVLAPWFHPIFLPFSLAPFAWGAGSSLLSRWRGEPRTTPGPGVQWPLVVGVAVGLCALLGPPVLADFSSIAARSKGVQADVAPVMKIFDLLSGANRPLLSFGLGLALLHGVVATMKRWNGFLGCLLFSTACQVATLLAAGPVGMSSSITVVRYVLPALVALLVLVAIGLEQFDGLLRREWSRFPPHAVTVGLSASLLVLGPLRAIHHRPNNWTNHAMLQYDYSPTFARQFATQTLGLTGIPAFYLQLAEKPSSGERIVEAPWYFEWYRIPYAVYQSVHKRRMLIGFVSRGEGPLPVGELPWPDPRFHFRNFVHVSDLAGMRERNVRYLIFHRHPPRIPDDDVHPRLVDVESWIREYEERVGAPVYRDEDLCVFDLHAER